MKRGSPWSGAGILFLIETDGLGGSERAMSNVAIAAAREGFRVAAGVGDLGWLRDHLTAHRIPVAIFPEIPDARAFAPGGLLRLLALARRHRADLISTFSFQMHLYGCLAGQILRRPCLVNLRNAHGDLGTNRRRRLWRHFIVPASARITAVSAAARDQLLACAPSARRLIAVVPNGVDTAAVLSGRPADEVRRELGLGDGPIVGAVGRLQEVKRHADLVEAAAIVSRQFADVRTDLRTGLRVLIAGECFEPVYSDLRRRAARLGMADRVHLLGERRDLPDLLQIMDVYVQSSASEGMSNALLEAMAAGRPVVATAVGGTPEVVTDGETGLLVPAAEPARLADAIAALLADPARARRVGEAARARVERDFSASRMLARHLDGCRALLQRRG